jgi:Fur family transcriptional regulator, ferric uptake regulator
MSATTHAQAEAMIRETGARVTRPRVAVLAALLAAEHALTHHEVAERVDRRIGVDRVTIYRVLDWLDQCGLAHKIAGDDRVGRYNAAAHAYARAHAHFQCSRCGTVICLDELDAAPQVRLPAGYVPQQVELTLKGLCAGCVAPPRGRSSPRASRH